MIWLEFMHDMSTSPGAMGFGVAGLCMLIEAPAVAVILLAWWISKV